MFCGIHITFALQFSNFSSPFHIGLEECSSAVSKFEIEQPVSVPCWLLKPFWVLFWVVGGFFCLTQEQMLNLDSVPDMFTPMYSKLGKIFEGHSFYIISLPENIIWKMKDIWISDKSVACWL